MSQDQFEINSNDDFEIQLDGENLIGDESLELVSEEGDSESDFNDNDENLEFVEHDQLVSIVESILFTTDRPQSIAAMKQAFRGTQVKSKMIRKALEELKIDYAGGRRGITLEEIGGGYQLRSKYDNMDFLRRMIKGRSFKLSGPALETLAIIAYKQPCVKFQVDEIRGVESGHLVRSLMERGLLKFAGKSEMPGKPMLYETTRKFLEIFGLRNIKELPTIGEIDELIPEGIEEIQEDKESLDDITENMSQDAGTTYSEGEEELESITSQLVDIDTSSEFFEKEKQRMRDKRDNERAKDINDAIMVGEAVSEKDKKWLDKHERKIAELALAAIADAEVSESELELMGESLQATDDAEVSESNESELLAETFQVISESEAIAEEASGIKIEAKEESLQASAESEADFEFDPASEVLDSAFEEDAERDEIERVAIGQVNFDKLEEDLKIFDEPSESIDRHSVDEDEKN